jgi:hypothetical protein
MAESLYLPPATAVRLFTSRVVDDPTPRRAAALGAGLGLLTLTRAEGVLLALVVAVALVFRLRTDLRRRLMTGAIALVVALAVVTPWTVRNAIRLHAFVPVSNNLATLVDGANCDTTYSGSQLGLWRETFSTQGDRARTLPQGQACFEGFDIGSDHFDEVDVANHHRNDGIKYAVHHLGSAPKVAAARWLRTWGLFAPRQQVDFESLEGRPRAWQWAGTVMYWVLLPLAVAGAVACHRRKATIWPMHASAITVSIVASLTYGQQRFRVGAEPVLLVLAAVAMVTLAARVRRPAERL